MRFKRELKVSKNNEVELTLSEIYQPETQRRNECLEFLKDILQESSNSLDSFCIEVFQEFYMWEP
jgi:hypothetical protein